MTTLFSTTVDFDQRLLRFLTYSQLVNYIFPTHKRTGIERADDFFGITSVSDSSLRAPADTSEVEPAW